MARKTYRILHRDNGRVGTFNYEVPGRYAGCRNGKVFGRLDCESGKRLMNKENRVFFMSWEDARKCGYRPCKKCKPEIVRVGDRLDYDHPGLARLLRGPHVSLWQSHPKPYRYPRNRNRYVCLNWDEMCEGRKCSGQANLSGHFFFPRAFSSALKFGRLLNVPVIKHDVTDMVVLWLPSGRSTAYQRELVKQVREGKTKDLYVGKGWSKKYSAIVYG